jgi:hypothetical protein
VRYDTGLLNENEFNRPFRADLGLTPLRFIVTDNIPMAPKMKVEQINNVLIFISSFVAPSNEFSNGI